MNYPAVIQNPLLQKLRRQQPVEQSKLIVYNCVKRDFQIKKDHFRVLRRSY